LTERPLEEIEIDPEAMTEADRAAKERLERFITRQLSKTQPPPLVDAYGRPESKSGSRRSKKSR